MMNTKTYVIPEMEIIEFDLDVRTDSITVSGTNDGSGAEVWLPDDWDN